MEFYKLKPVFNCVTLVSFLKVLHWSFPSSSTVVTRRFIIILNSAFTSYFRLAGERDKNFEQFSERYLLYQKWKLAQSPNKISRTLYFPDARPKFKWWISNQNQDLRKSHTGVCSLFWELSAHTISNWTGGIFW